MSLQGTFSTSVQGMNTQAHAMSVISSNIANVATTGYKTARTNFQTILNHERPNNQKFLAVRAIDTRNVSEQGQIQTTDRALDLAVNGRGFIVTNTATDRTGIWQYTRDGAMFGRAVTLPTTDPSGVPEQGTLLVTAGGAHVYGWQANSDGTFTEADDFETLTPVMIQTGTILPAQMTSNIGLQANISEGSPNRQTVTVPFIDANGVSQTLTIGVTETLDAGWNVDFTTSNGAPVAADATDITFDGFGRIATPSGEIINLSLVNPDFTVQDIALDLSGTTSFASQGEITVHNVSDDGYIEGRLERTYFNSEGVLLGSYSNGELKTLYKLPIATFQVDNNLAAMPGNYFLRTHEAGAVTLRGLGTGGTSTGGTTFVAGALERSTVDIADQFSRMIVTQRAYSSSAQVLRTADEMTQAARDLKR